MASSIPSLQWYPQTHGQFNTLLTGVSQTHVQYTHRRGIHKHMINILITAISPNTCPGQYPPHRGILKHMASSIPSLQGYPQIQGQFNTLLTEVPPPQHMACSIPSSQGYPQTHGQFNTLLTWVSPITWPVQYPPNRGTPITWPVQYPPHKGTPQHMASSIPSSQGPNTLPIQIQYPYHRISNYSIFIFHTPSTSGQCRDVHISYYTWYLNIVSVLL